MPHRLAVRLVLVASLVLFARCFSLTAHVQPKIDNSPHRVTLKSTPRTASSNPAGDEQIIVNTDLVTFNVTVTDKYGHCVSGLPQSAFTVFDEKKPQEIIFFSDEDSPVSVGIIFDLTGSMTDDKMMRAREAIAHFIETSHDTDEYFLITLQDGRTLLSLDRTRDSNALIKKLTYVEPRGQTAFYDACYLGVNKLLQATHPKRALLIISDGQDNNSLYTFEELRRILKESDVSIYSIGLEGAGDGYLGIYGKDILDEMTAVTGGKSFYPKTAEEMNDAFERIALELRRQYAIGYRPTDFKADGKWRRVKVKVNPPPGLPPLFIRSRNGYYAQAHTR